ncbi:MAG: hypothetical protein WAV98_03555 [Minisyncoccia bacterium]
MSFSSNGVTFNRTKWIRNRIFRLFFRGAEGVLSVLLAISMAGPMIFPQDAHAAGVAKPLSYQGRLTNGTGDPYSGTYCMRFSVWDVGTGGTANPNQLWPLAYATPYTKTITATNGVFDTLIGTALGGDDDLSTFDFSSNDTTYLSVDVYNVVGASCTGGAWESLTPRQRLGAVAYARVAADVYGIALRTSPTKVQIGGGGGQATPIWARFDNQNTGVMIGATCPSGSVMGDMWYNSAGTRALFCGSGTTIVALDNISDFAGIKESAAGTTVNAGSIVLSNAGGISISQSTATLATNQTNQRIGTFGFSNLNAAGMGTGGNSLGTNGTATGTVFFAGGNNITLSQATGAGARTITIIGPAAGGGAALQGSGTYSQNTGTVQFGNSNGITFGLSNNGTMTASHNGLTVQSAQPVAISGSNGSFLFSTVSFGNLNGLSFYTSNGSIVGSYTAGAGGGFGSFSAGTQNVTGGTLIFDNANGVSFGLNSNANGSHTITASVAAAGGAAPTLTYWDNMPWGATNNGGVGGMAFTGSHRSLFVTPLNEYFRPFFGDMTANTAYINLSQSGSTATMSIAFTSNFYLGIYTLNGSTLSLINSVNASFAKNPAATNNSTAFVGQRFLSIHSSQWSSQPVFKNGSQYYLGYFWSSAGALNQTNSLLGYYKYSSLQRFGTIGTSGTATSQGWGPFYGIYTATTGAFPAAISSNQLNKVNANAGFTPHVIFNNAISTF